MMPTIAKTPPCATKIQWQRLSNSICIVISFQFATLATAIYQWLMVMDEERTRPHHWPASVIWVSFSVLTLFWSTRNLYHLAQMTHFWNKQRKKLKGNLANSDSPVKQLLKWGEVVITVCFFTLVIIILTRSFISLPLCITEWRGVGAASWDEM